MKKLLLSLAALMVSLPALFAQEVAVTLKYVSPTITDNVMEKVFTSKEAFSGEFLNDGVVGENEITYNCIPAVGFNFEPADDYKIYSVTTNIPDDNLYNLFVGKYQSSITIFAGVPDQVTINIEVVEEDYSAVKALKSGSASFPVYNLLGVKVMDAESESDLSSLHKGIYVIKGKKYVVQ